MKAVFFIMVFATCCSVAQKKVGGNVTYLASGSVYLSIGKNQGLEDSMRVFVLRSSDTISVLQVFAISSKSSVCKILEGRKSIQLGDSVSTMVPARPLVFQQNELKFDSTAQIQIDTSSRKVMATSILVEKQWLNIRGRIGFQYNAVIFDDAQLNMQQPGLVVSLRGDIPNVPIKFDIYGTARMTGRNNTSPLSSRATNDSRLYRLSFEYDDQTTIVGAGRILPVYASSVGYVDGVSVARRIGKMISGVALGFQPTASLQFPTTDTKKFLVYTQYQPSDTWNTTASASYARIWSSLGIEREALSTYVTMFSPSGFSLYASGDVDLRTLSNGESRFSPALSLLICSANYRVSEIVTAGVSIDASRPVYSLSSNKTIPDSLLDKELRTGVSFNANFSIWRGSGFYNVYTIRLAGTRNGSEYSNNSSFYYNNVAKSRVNVRANYLVNESSFTRMHGYGFNLQRNVLGADIGIRYQQNRSNIFQLNMTNTTTTLGADISMFLTNRLTLMGSFDLLRGLGSTSKSLFIELSRRF